MKAVICKAFGPPEQLVIEEVDDPQPGPGQVLIKVASVPVTFPDTLMLEDKYQFKVELPYVPGGEVGGTIAALGEGVEGLSVGDRVVGSTTDGVSGAFAELALASADRVRVLGDSVGFAESTGLGYAYGTTWYALKERGQLKAGETLLVLGAGGHLGITAIQLGKIAGATVIAAASTEAKLDLCREAGADITINYALEDLKNRTKELTGGAGVDVIYDPVGGDYAEAALRAMAWNGRFLVIGFTAGIPSMPLNLTLLKSCSIVGVFYGAMRAKEPELDGQILSELLELIEAGRLTPPISERHSLEDAPVALRRMMDRVAVGKVVLEF